MVKEALDPRDQIPENARAIIEIHKPFHYCIGIGDDYQRRMFIPIPAPEGHDPNEVWYRQEMELIVNGNNGISIDNEVIRTTIGDFQYGGDLNATVKYLADSGHDLIDFSWLQ